MSDELQRAMGRVEAKVDLLIELTGKYDDRLTKVERKVWWSSGAAAVIAFITTNLIGKH
ncbi:hypothetical protein V1290_000068 [Bradyrhizobium sp. AZCC 1578]|uniref:hypothetical protein n=1 Tax=Bradyrhizobium sp. AZCC 1578 TaxID=3117027 RepID=UPI002FF10BF6